VSAEPPNKANLSGREIILTVQRNGQWLEARAIDVETGIEAVTMGPVNAARFDLERLATNKLRFILRREGIVIDNYSPPNPPKRPGIVV
jgi:hypothetical protein